MVLSFYLKAKNEFKNRMKRISDYSKSWENDVTCVHRVLYEWHPQSFALSEPEQQKDLQIWLQRNLPEVPIAQSEIETDTPDLVIEDYHIIQVKLGFTEESRAECYRCIGQLECYRQKWVDAKHGVVYLVVVGESQAEFHEMIHKSIELLNQGHIGRYFFLVEKFPVKSNG